MTSVPNKLFVSGINFQTSNSSFQAYFERYGPIKKAHVIKQVDRSDRNRGFGFVEFTEASSASKVLESKEPHVLDGFTLSVQCSDNSNNKRQDDHLTTGQSTGQFRLWIGGLSSSAREQDLLDYFGQFGSVVSAIVCTPVDKTPFGFVSFATKKAQEAALNQNDHLICNSAVDLRIAKSKEVISTGASRSNHNKDNGNKDKRNSRSSESNGHSSSRRRSSRSRSPTRHHDYRYDGRSRSPSRQVEQYQGQSYYQQPYYPTEQYQYAMQQQQPYGQSIYYQQQHHQPYYYPPSYYYQQQQQAQQQYSQYNPSILASIQHALQNNC